MNNLIPSNTRTVVTAVPMNNDQALNGATLNHNPIVIVDEDIWRDFDPVKQLTKDITDRSIDIASNSIKSPLKTKANEIPNSTKIPSLLRDTLIDHSVNKTTQVVKETLHDRIDRCYDNPDSYLSRLSHWWQRRTHS